jgi:anaerobic selenocysteine-containing dehydrogenase
MFGLRSPAIQPPLYDVRNTGDVLIEIAKGLGGSVAKSFPWKDFQDALRDAIRGIFVSKRGSIQARDFDEFWNALIERGGWWDPPYRFGEWKKMFNTLSGKFEFFSIAMEQGLKEVSKRSSKGMDQILKELKIEVKASDDRRRERVSLPPHPLCTYDCSGGARGQSTFPPRDLWPSLEREMELLD